MKNFYYFLIWMSLLLGIVSLTFSIRDKQQFAQTVGPTFGSSAFLPVEGIPYSVSKTVLPTDGTITLSSFNTPDGRQLTMADFGSIGYGTLDPNNLTRLESVSFTGIVPQSNNTVQLTGVLRGLDFISPYAASSSLAQTHLVGSTFILSNTSAFYGNQFLFANNAGTSSAILVFSSTTPPRYDADPVWGNFTTQALADVSYVNSVVAAGAANGSETVKGIFQLASGSQASVGTSLGNTGARLILGNNLATSSPYSGTPQGSIPSTAITGGKLSQSFWDLTQNFTVSGLWSFLGAETNSASTTFNATTTIAASSTIANALRLNGINYAFPFSQAASSTILETDGNGNLSWEIPSTKRYIFVDTTGTSTPSNNTVANGTTTTIINIPANTMTASSTITVEGLLSTFGSAGSPTYAVSIETTAGATLATFNCSGTPAINQAFNITIANNSSTASQLNWAQCGGSITTFTTSLNTANAFSLVLFFQATAEGATGIEMSLSKNVITVNP